MSPGLPLFPLGALACCAAGRNNCNIPASSGHWNDTRPVQHPPAAWRTRVLEDWPEVQELAADRRSFVAGSAPARIMLVDDEPELRQVLTEYLAKYGFVVRSAAGGAELDALLAEHDADLLVLDVNMPGEDGISIARRMRAARGALPILMLTAVDGVVDRIVGLEIGADDYVTKPFDLRELLARVRALLRRAGDRVAVQAPVRPAADAASAPAAAAGTGLSASPGKRVRFGRMLLDLDARCLVSDDGRPAELTAMEYDLLHVFAQNPNRVLTRGRLLDLAHHRDDEPFDRSIDVRVARIRRKVEWDPAKPQAIRTMRGAGYMFVPS